MQCGNSTDLLVVYEYQTHNFRRDEQLIHKYLKSSQLHIRGEWFILNEYTNYEALVVRVISEEEWNEVVNKDFYENTMASTHRKFIAIYVSAYTTAYCTYRYALTREKVGIRGGVNDRSISHPFRHLFQTSTSGRPRSIPDTEFIGEFSNKMVPKRHNPASQSVETLTKETF